MKSKGLLFKNVNRTPVIPVRLKIIVVFVLFILISNFTSNYINLMYNRNHQIKLMKMLLAKDLKDIIGYANTQYEIFQFNQNETAAFNSIREKALYEMDNDLAILLMFNKNGQILVQVSPEGPSWTRLDREVLNRLNTETKNGAAQGFITVENDGYEYLGIYKYNDKWDAYFYRAEEYGEFTAESRNIFQTISLIILGSTLVLTVVGIFVLGYLLRFIGIISNSIMEMIKNQQLELIPLKNAPNDDITYLGMAFNSLSSTIETLLQIFKRFTNKDIAYRAYKEKDIRLEGTQKELAILFTDIKGFTTITETLGTDIIKLINLHYDRAIREIVRYDGTIGSIIGDALLAMFGTLEEISDKNKSVSAVMAAYEIHAVAESLRLEMTRKKEALIRSKGGLTTEEERVYNAVMLEVGVGIDGGDVFYGNIGSYVRMTNTVIGDRVNSASRLEGLTRVYKVPVICSDYIKEDVENNTSGSGITFLEIDTVQVKGKTIGRSVYWPLLDQYMTKELKSQMNKFSRALKLYYDGKWTTAHREFSAINLPIAEVFRDRTQSKKAPRNWNGIWAMKSK
ncbi:MAG: adenylate/guanylate cyclase domain-containing protein [Spirochaetota bacterium]